MPHGNKSPAAILPFARSNPQPRQLIATDSLCELCHQTGVQTG